jgi:polyhydroxybutyrate depolymerase
MKRTRLMRRAATVGAVVPLAVACARQTTAPGAGETRSESVTSLGRQRTYTIYLPPAYRGGASLPVLLAFHGAGGTGAGMHALLGDTLADRFGFIAVYPDAVAEARHTWALGCPQCTWADVAGVDDYRFVRDLLDTLTDRYGVDGSRVYAAGISLGGSFAYDLACRETDLLAGTAVVASLPSIDELAVCRASTRPLRVITSIGDRDPNVPWDGGVGGSGATYRGAEATAADWANRDGCAPAPRRRDLPDRNGDGRRVGVLEFTDCPGGAFVRFFKIEGGGHEWPRSNEFDVSAEIARSFFGDASP